MALYLIIVLHLVAAIGFTIAASMKPDRSFELLLCMCLLSSQSGLLGIWVAAARSARRRLLLPIGVAVLTVETCAAAKISLPSAVAIALAPTACLAGSLHFACRKLGIELRRIVSMRTGRPPQFTIAFMLMLTAAVGLLIAAAQQVTPILRIGWIRPLINLHIDDYLLDMACFSFCGAAVAGGCTWSLLAGSWSWWRLAALGTVPLAGGMLTLIVRGGHEWWIFVFAAFVEEAIVGGTLLAARLCHYRLLRRPSA